MVLVLEKNNKFISRLNINGNCKNLGHFDTESEAFNVYKIAKEEYIKNKANDYKEYLPEQIYESLMNYEVSMTD